jgi:hypothetical protein
MLSIYFFSSMPSDFFRALHILHFWACVCVSSLFMILQRFMNILSAYWWFCGFDEVLDNEAAFFVIYFYLFYDGGRMRWKLICDDKWVPNNSYRFYTISESNKNCICMFEHFCLIDVLRVEFKMVLSSSPTTRNDLLSLILNATTKHRCFNSYE